MGKRRAPTAQPPGLPPRGRGRQWHGRSPVRGARGRPGGCRDHRVRRGTAAGLRPGSPQRVLQRPQRRRTRSAAGGLGRPSGHARGRRRPRHRPRIEVGTNRQRSKRGLRHAGAGDGFIPVRSAHPRQRPAALPRLPHDRGSGGHQGFRPRRQAGRRGRRRSAGTRSRQRPQEHGPRHRGRGVRARSHGRAARRWRQHHVATHDREAGRRRPHRQEHAPDHGRRVRPPPHGVRGRRVARDGSGGVLGRHPSPRRTRPGVRIGRWRARRRRHRRVLRNERPGHPRHRRMRPRGRPYFRAGGARLRDGEGRRGGSCRAIAAPASGAPT